MPFRRLSGLFGDARTDRKVPSGYEIGVFNLNFYVNQAVYASARAQTQTLSAREQSSLFWMHPKGKKSFGYSIPLHHLCAEPHHEKLHRSYRLNRLNLSAGGKSIYSGTLLQGTRQEGKSADKI